MNVSGGQFYWSISPRQVPAGTKVRFDVTSVDVNHGFGIYDPDGQADRLGPGDAGLPQQARPHARRGRAATGSRASSTAASATTDGRRLQGHRAGDLEAPRRSARPSRRRRARPGADARHERRVGWLFAGTGLALFAVMGLLGLAMRLTQAEILDVSPDLVLPADDAARRRDARRRAARRDGRALVRAAATVLAPPRRACSGATGDRRWRGRGAGVGRRRRLRDRLDVPLPAAVRYRGRVGDPGRPATFLSACCSSASASSSSASTCSRRRPARYGGLQRALGITFLRGRDDSPPPPQVIAAAVVALEGLLASAVGTTILVALLGRVVRLERARSTRSGRRTSPTSSGTRSRT